MKKLLFIVLAICILIGGPVWAAKDELRIYIWTDYMDEPMMAAKFKEKFGSRFGLKALKALRR